MSVPSDGIRCYAQRETGCNNLHKELICSGFSIFRQNGFFISRKAASRETGYFIMSYEWQIGCILGVLFCVCCVQPTKPVHLKGLQALQAFGCTKTCTSKTNWRTKTCVNLIHLILIGPAYFYSNDARISKMLSSRLFGCVLANSLFAHAPVSSGASSVAFSKHADCSFPQATCRVRSRHASALTGSTHRETTR